MDLTKFPPRAPNTQLVRKISDLHPAARMASSPASLLGYLIINSYVSMTYVTIIIAMQALEACGTMLRRMLHLRTAHHG